MSGVRAASQVSVEETESELDIPELLDILYDIVATGVEVGGRVSVEQIEQFLHEHARHPHSLEQFQAFFDKHGIEARSQTEPRIPLRMLEPVPNAEAPVAPLSQVHPETVEAAMLPPTLPGTRSPYEHDSFERLSATVRRWGLAAAAVAAFGLGLAGWGISTLLSDLRDARALAERTEGALLSQMARESAMEATLSENRAEIERLTSENQTLLDNLLPSPVVRVDR